MNFITYIDEICANFKINSHFQGKAQFGPFKGETWIFENGFIKAQVTFIDMNGELVIFSPYKNPFIDINFKKFNS